MNENENENNNNKNKNKLPSFKKNDVKSFKFNKEQYITLEIEYNRYTIYKELIKNIENILKINDVSNDYSNRKIYENKNIIDRFVLECINHGVSPKLNVMDTMDTVNTIDTMDTVNVMNTMDSVDTMDTMDSVNVMDIENLLINVVDNDNDNDNMEELSNNLFFNKCLNVIERLRKCIFFKKMIAEYIEKKIKITPDKILKIEQNIVDLNLKFLSINRLLILNKNEANIFRDIFCSIYLIENDMYLIKYRNYTKMINFKRYSKLIRNYDRPFPYDIIRMILRYSIFDTSNQQWSIGINLYEHISYLFDIGFEMFASPLNFNMNMFCSIFLDTDKIFGSCGSFYNLSLERLLNQNIKGVIFNPPYLPILMKHTTIMCINLLEKMDNINVDFTIISFLPNWIDADYIQSFLQSKYLVEHKVVNKGNYILHEKDKGKLIRGTFELLVIVMNSKKNVWNNDKIVCVNKNFKDIIKMMKDETIGRNIEM